MLTTNSRADLFQAVTRCDACVRAGDCKVLRDERTNPPQPGYVGLGYDASRILVIGQNPGAANGEAAYSLAERTYVDRLKAIADGGEVAVARLNDFAAGYVKSWRLYAQVLGPLLGQSGLTLDDVAYLNVVRCRTAGNAKPSKLMVTTCDERHFRPWLRELRPRAAVCLGVATADMARPALAAYGIPMEVISRERSLPGDARWAEIQRVASFLKAHRDT